MDKFKPAPDGVTTNDARADWTVDTIADQISRSLNGSVAREAFVQIIKQVAPRYEDARIQIFVPILIQRDVMNELLTRRKTLAPLDAEPGMGEQGAAGV